MDQQGIPGLSLTVIQQDQEDQYAIGWADVEQQVALTPQHRMFSGSIGKTYFAAQIMLLAAEGKVDLEAKASEYLGHEKWFKALPNASEMTIRSLLNHTSGVPEYVYDQNLWKTVKAQPTKVWTAAERLAYISDQKAHFPTGKGWSYADANFIILGAVVEKITGEKIYDLVQQNILDPLQLRQTEPSIQAQIANLTAAYTGNMFGQIFGEKVSNLGQYGFNPQLEWTGGGFVTNSTDLARWVKGLYTSDLLDPSSKKAVYSPVNRQTGLPNLATGYGLGAEIFATSYGVAYGHSGFMPGFLSVMAYLPDYEMAVALQVNTDPYSSLVKQRIDVFNLLEEVLPFYINKNVAYAKKTKIYFVRHAEKADDGTRDPDLNAKGKARAENLAKVLADAGIDAIYSTPYKRTMQTGQPLADALQLEIQSYNPSSNTVIFDIIANNPGATILVVGHSNTTPALINQLVKKDQLPQLKESEYGDLFKVTYKKGKGKLKRKQY
ncbi:MAG: hypothetical protein Sapg2KO_26240 [Saprospiraceae bacterium]